MDKWRRVTYLKSNVGVIEDVRSTLSSDTFGGDEYLSLTRAKNKTKTIHYSQITESF